MIDPAFKGVATKVGMTIWRIEQLQVVMIQVKDHGVFFEGDSYLLLHTEKTGPNNFSYNIHFWLGKYTSQDESGAAAYKAVELDDVLNGCAVQYRECQGHESAKFTSYFTKGITYRPGGTKSGFRHVNVNKATTRLLHVKGKRRVRMSEVPPRWASFNSGDVFILDHGKDVYVWNGKQSNRMERLQAVKAACGIRDDLKGGDAKVHIVEETDPPPSGMVELLGSPEPIKTATSAPPDEEFERSASKKIKMYRISDSSGSLLLTEVGTTPLTQSLLHSADCFIIDQGAAGIFVWKGKNANKEEKAAAMKNASAFIKTKKYPPHTQIVAVIDGAEPPSFKMLFSDWKNKHAQVGLGTAHSINRVAKITAQTQFDVTSLHAKPEVAASARMVDDGTGKTEVWVVENFDIVPVDDYLHGQFFAGDCYVVKYTYHVKNKPCYILYYWIGSDSSQDEQGTVALKTIELDDLVSGTAMQVRVVQGKEPNHFLAIFRGRLIVHLGGKSSGFRNANIDNKKTMNLTRNHLFQIRGTDKLNTRCVEVACVGSSLNSNDSFVLKSKEAVYLWFGKACTGDEREMAKNCASILSPRDIEVVMEGKETDQFWRLLGGKQPYSSSKAQLDPEHEPRLFQCSNAVGYFRVEEIMAFQQEDLCEDDVMILDTWYDLFVWVGNRSNPEERRKAMETARQYVQTDPCKRESTLSIYQVKQGHEPIIFTGFFHGWSPDRFQTSAKYIQMRAQLSGQSDEATREQVEAEMKLVNGNNGYSEANGSSGHGGRKGAGFSYEYLKSAQSNLSEEIDPTVKEQYLEDSDFQRVFRMSREEFNQKPHWKKIEIKKQVGLF
ncbi:advillin-like isoform X2 [Convolutriloba macropyga]|uniref:advillin-like isoform X2 n=1 Tax=Convolutriloba macropyga TaxID=536237 RepID=UPI003F51F294